MSKDEFYQLYYFLDLYIKTFAPNENLKDYAYNIQKSIINFFRKI